MIRVVLVDDQHLVRAGFRSLLERVEDIEVVGEAENGAQALEVVVAERPDVVLMDIRMPVLDGLQATRRIVADPTLTAVRILVLTTYDDDEFVFEAIRVGASGFLLKDTEPDELRRAVRVVAAGDSLLSPGVTSRVMRAAAGHSLRANEATERLHVLTEREREVLTHVGAGRSNDEIAADLYMSPATARTHVSRIMTKLEARDRSQLVVIAHRCGLVGY
ncbi:response regulator transcription factor [Nocardia uniformis]|uniref:Response regulator transcription factor n=2 Tax=Nocardia uniformis TaxID=53432 RepID=A0A849CDY6_9NOCA|nr:response regulator transcription factor [Nocardia uniformis]